MTIGSILTKAAARPITLSAAEISKRKQTAHAVFMEVGHGILNPEVLQSMDLFATGQLTPEEAQEIVLRVSERSSISQEQITPK